MVRFRPGGSPSRCISATAKGHVTSWKPLFRFKNKTLGTKLGLDRFYVAEGLSAQSATSLLKAQSGVEIAQPACNVHLATTPNDPMFYQQWHLQNNGTTNGGSGSVTGSDIKATQAWNITTGASNVTIAIIDTGIDLLHPDLISNIGHNENETPNNGIDDDRNGYIDDTVGWNFVTNSTFPQGNNNTQDDRGHGTSCAGIAAASGNNGLFVTGVAWNCKLMPVKAFDASGNGDETWLSQSIIYAVDNGANVISLSVVLDEDTVSVHTAVQYAIESNVVVCAAMGNDWSGRIRYPAAIPDVIAVGAANNNDTRAPFSNWG
ncbi:MAG: S8 family serine peptidase, partial [Armatimonadota bacterium]